MKQKETVNDRLFLFHMRRGSNHKRERSRRQATKQQSGGLLRLLSNRAQARANKLRLSSPPQRVFPTECLFCFIREGDRTRNGRVAERGTRPAFLLSAILHTVSPENRHSRFSLNPSSSSGGIQRGISECRGRNSPSDSEKSEFRAPQTEANIARKCDKDRFDIPATERKRGRTSRD